MTDRSRCPYCGSGGEHAGKNEYFANRWEYGCGSFWNDAAEQGWQNTGYCSGLEEGREQGYDEAIADVTKWMRSHTDDGCFATYAYPSYKAKNGDRLVSPVDLDQVCLAIERGEAKGASQ